MNEQVIIYEIKSGARSNADELFSPDGSYFYWNSKFFSHLDVGDYVFVINRFTPSVTFCRLDSPNIPVAHAEQSTSFEDLGVTYNVDGIWESFVRLEVIEKIHPRPDWGWRSLGMAETVYLNGPRVNRDTTEKRLADIEILKTLSTNDVYQSVLADSERNLLELSERNPAIVRALGSETVQALLQESEFYFGKAQQALSELENVTAEPDFYQRVLSSFTANNIPFKTLFESLTPATPEYDLYSKIGKVISYCDKSAAYRSEFNEYSDQRVLAKAFVRQTDWVKGLLLYKANGHDPEPLPKSIRNAICYLKNPVTELTMLSENQREMVARRLLNIAYDKNTFVGSVIRFFEPYALQPGHPDNLTHIITTILYSVKSLWDETPVNSTPTMDEPPEPMSIQYDTKYRTVLLALRTKPFLLLAGLSGTGKSRLVRTLAYKTCWPEELRQDLGKPGNFELIPVKPNWHDSAELMGYVSRINNEKYITTTFLKFIAKAWRYPDVPFFLCLDEMNLAPVEQYFAEYLSLLETRVSQAGEMKSDFLLSINDFENPDLYGQILNDLDLSEDLRFSSGLSLPGNLVVIGTVNMDETTHSFSRKVLDRAMTLEMNEIDLSAGLDIAEGDWSYPDRFISPDNLIGTYSAGSEVFTKYDEAVGVISHLNRLNEVMDGSPFKVAYRVRDEFLIYCYYSSLLEDKPSDWFNCALDEMTAMKVLSRIEGDAAKTEKVIEELSGLLRDEYPISAAKVQEMSERLKSTGYTSYWT